MEKLRRKFTKFLRSKLEIVLAFVRCGIFVLDSVVWSGFPIPPGLWEEKVSDEEDDFQKAHDEDEDGEGVETEIAELVGIKLPAEEDAEKNKSHQNERAQYEAKIGDFIWYAD